MFFVIPEWTVRFKTKVGGDLLGPIYDANPVFNVSQNDLEPLLRTLIRNGAVYIEMYPTNLEQETS